MSHAAKNPSKTRTTSSATNVPTKKTYAQNVKAKRRLSKGTWFLLFLLTEFFFINPLNVISKHKTHEQQNREQQLEENLIASLSERQRRSYFRKLERGDDEGAEKILEKARNAEEDDDDWSFGESELEDDDEDEEEELEELEDEEDEEDDEISEGVSKMNMLAKEE